MAPTENRQDMQSTAGEPLQVANVANSSLVKSEPSRQDTSQPPVIETPTVPSSGAPGTVQIRFRATQIQIDEAKSSTRE